MKYLTGGVCFMSRFRGWRYRIWREWPCKMKTFWDTDWLYLFSIIFNLRFPWLLNLGISSRFPLFITKISSCLYISEVDSRLSQSNPYISQAFLHLEVLWVPGTVYWPQGTEEKGVCQNGKELKRETERVCWAGFEYLHAADMSGIDERCSLLPVVACMTGALWAKRGERDISRGARHEREARDEGKRKILSLVSRSARNIAFAPLGS